MKKYKYLYIFLAFLIVLSGLWVWEVGFHTGKYSRQETPFNVPGRIIKSITESTAIKKYEQKLKTNFEQLTVGKPAPTFSLPGQKEGQQINLSKYHGKVVLLEFWASWCGDCRRSNSYLSDLYEQHRNNNFEIISLSMDRSLRAWRKAIRTDQMTWPQACDGKGVESEIMIQYGVFSLPRNFLVNEEGLIVGKDMEVKEINNWLAANK